MILNSNVVKLKGISSLPSALPVNLTSITFGAEFDDALLAGYLPPNLKKLKFSWDCIFNQPIRSGVLPNTLEKLSFSEYFNQALEPNVLPSSLTYLELGYDYSHTLQVGSLPPNLRVLIHHGFSEISNGVLPKSLCTLKGAALSWIPFIKPLPNLTALSFFHVTTNITLDLSNLPASLTSLDINATCRLTSTVSPSIKHLNLTGLSYDIDEIFKDRSQYHFEELSVDAFKQESLDNLKIKELILRFPVNVRQGTLRDIPCGVETLNFGTNQQIKIRTKQNEFPSSLRKIIFQNCSTISSLDFQIPNTIEEVVIQEILYVDNGYPFTSELIPNSVKSMTVPSSMIEYAFLFDRLPSVTNICFARIKNRVDLQVRKIYGYHYLIFGQYNDKFIAAIVSSLLSEFIDNMIEDEQ
ncbi:hypothetical protein PPL_06558 [Heterostelium album PN500]|uniref:Uncharacterized protein n=1 Tax=Heterostelium pallidum (strain ATCC 26659 / Pp 5 / PN500) TaxID=670386 RepID=D3BDH5_HETP5|nr:hypothetical protein PPL_06558 [Heterostelium album PN500]EFA80619.1 hypothetical protein PPL_06558 [Heterostelium album PN500]|eukprot:XP_020432739.1 hypothetical protein PPL_06558 [Heterostelium album PN500]